MRDPKHMKLRAHVVLTALGASSLAIALLASAQAQPSTAPSTTMSASRVIARW